MPWLAFLGHDQGDPFLIFQQRSYAPKNESSGRSGFDRRLDGQLGGNLTGRPIVRSAQAVDRNARINWNLVRINDWAAPPLQERGKTLGALVAPVKLRRKIIDPAVSQPSHRIGVKILVLIQFYGDRGRIALSINAEGTYPEQNVGPGGLDSVV